MLGFPFQLYKTKKCWIATRYDYLWVDYFRGPDIDDDDDDDDGARPGPSNGEAKPKSGQQRAGEALLRRMLELTEGACYSFE